MKIVLLKEKKHIKKINSFLNLLSIENKNKMKISKKTTDYDIKLVKKKKISQLKKSLGPLKVKAKKKTR